MSFFATHRINILNFAGELRYKDDTWYQIDIFIDWADGRFSKITEHTSSTNDQRIHMLIDG